MPPAPRRSMPSSLTVQLAGIPVRFEPSYLLFMTILGLSKSLVATASWLICGTVALVVHELGHALLVRAYGQRPQIALGGFGGVTRWANSPPLSVPRRIWVSLAGPAAGIAMGLAVLALLPAAADGTTAGLVRHDLLYVSLGWSAFNLLPILPLDGGHALQFIVQWITGKQWPRAAAAWSAVMWGLLVLGAFEIGEQILMILGGYMLAIEAAAAFRAPTAGDDPLLAPVRSLIAQQRFEEAFAALAALRKPPTTAAVVKRAAELEVPVAVALGDVETALAAVLELPPEVELGPLTCSNLLLHAGRADLVQARAEALLRPPLSGARDDGLRRAIPRAEAATLMLQALSRQDLDKAIAAALGELGREASPRWLAALAWRASDRGQLESARELITRAVHRQATPPAHFELALFEAGQGSIESSRAHLHQALELGFADRARILAEPALDAVRAGTDVMAAMERLPRRVPRADLGPWRPLEFRRAARRWPSALLPPPTARALAELPGPLPVVLPFQRVLAVAAQDLAPGPARIGEVAVQVLRSARLEAGAFVVELEGLARLAELDAPPADPTSPEEREALARALRAVAEETPECDPRVAERTALVTSGPALADWIGAALPLDDAARAELLAAAEPRARVALARRLLELRARALAELPEAHCPCCGFEPPARARWTCSHCSTHWNTFATRGRCPTCSHAYQATHCPRCLLWSRHDAWYTARDAAAAS